MRSGTGYNLGRNLGSEDPLVRSHRYKCSQQHQKQTFADLFPPGTYQAQHRKGIAPNERKDPKLGVRSREGPLDQEKHL